MYKAILIDWDDTIGDFAGAAARSLAVMYEQYGLSAHFDSLEQYVAIYTPHNVGLWEQYGRDEVTKDYLEFDRFFYPLMQAPRPMPLQDALALAPRMAQDHLSHTTDYFSPIPGAVETVRALAAKYKIIVASNGFVSVQYEKIRRSGLQDCFTDIVLSEEVGCQKPNRRFYEIALERNGLRPEDCVMVGDGWYSDIYGAQQLGIDTIWINPRHQVKDVVPTHEVTDILSVRDLLA